MAKLDSLTVFLASRMGNNERIKAATVEFGQLMVERSIRLVYGGAACGLMGLLADTVLKGGGDVIGVMPKIEDWGEITHRGLTELIMVDSMMERKEVLARYSPACAVLPGAFGTLDEMTEHNTWTQLDLHQLIFYKPCGILNADGFWTDYWKLLNDRMVGDGYMDPDTRDIVVIHEDPATLLDMIEQKLP